MESLTELLVAGRILEPKLNGGSAVLRFFKPSGEQDGFCVAEIIGPSEYVYRRWTPPDNVGERLGEPFFWQEFKTNLIAQKF